MTQQDCFYLRGKRVSGLMEGVIREVLWRNPQPSAGCSQTFLDTAGEGASMSRIWTDSHRLGERLLDHCTMLACLLTETGRPKHSLRFPNINMYPDTESNIQVKNCVLHTEECTLKMRHPFYVIVLYLMVPIHQINTMQIYSHYYAYRPLPWQKRARPSFKTQNTSSITPASNRYFTFHYNHCLCWKRSLMVCKQLSPIYWLLPVNCQIYLGLS